MIIKLTQHRHMYYYAQCQSCNWDTRIRTDERIGGSGIRYATRRHVLETGHIVIVITGKNTKYEREENVECPEAQKEEDALSRELKRGQDIATELIEHVKDMGAAATKMPITLDGDIWNVTVECITDSIKEKDNEKRK